MKNSFRYKGKNYEHKGVHTELMKKLLITNSFRPKLNLPKPYNVAEMSLLSEFIFGVKLTVVFDRVYDRLLDKLKKDKTFERAFKLNQLSENKKDFFHKNNYWSNNNKLELLYLSYECNEEYSNYDDHKFNREVFGSSYEMNDSFWRHCIGELSCGGISRCAYGYVNIYSLTERERLLNMIKNKNEPVRESFKNEIDKLIEENLIYDTSLEM